MDEEPGVLGERVVFERVTSGCLTGFEGALCEVDLSIAGVSADGGVGAGRYDWGFF